MKKAETYRGRKILLGSGSPRRNELLSMMDLPFSRVAIKDVDETFPENLAPENVPEFLSRVKSDAYRGGLHDDEVLVTADTVVILDGEILGKPSGRDEAIQMLGRLSGSEHKVVTGVTIASGSRSISFSETTSVWFRTLSTDEITYYVDTYRPFDKAGSYGIQEWIGLTAIEKIDGCFYNVMGLPTAALYRRLSEFLDTF